MKLKNDEENVGDENGDEAFFLEQENRIVTVLYSLRLTAGACEPIIASDCNGKGG